VRIGVIPMLVVASLAFPRNAGAQRAEIVRTLAELRASLEGSYGDESTEISRLIGALSEAPMSRDQSILRSDSLDPNDPVTAYLALARSTLDAADSTRAHDALVRMVEGRLRGTRSVTPTPFSHAVESLNAPDRTPLFPLARYADGLARATRGETGEAVALIRDATTRDPLFTDPASQTDGFRQGAAALRQGSLRAARAAFDGVVAAYPRSSEAHRMLATAAAIGGDTRTSVEHFDAALRIRPDDERSWIALANTQIDAGAFIDATRTLEKAVALIPHSGGLHWRLAGLLVRTEQNEAALAHYSEAERIMPLSGRSQVHQAVATLALVQLDAAGAAAALERRVQEDLNDASAHRDLASVYTRQGRQDKAFAELAIAAWLDADDPLTLVALGRSLMADRRDENAVAALERAVMLQPDLREARYALAQALTRVGKSEAARTHLLEFERQRAAAVAREQRDLDITAAKGEATTRSVAGQHRQAIEAWKKVIAIEPTVSQNYLDLGDALVKAGALEESVQYFVKAADLDGVAEVHLRLSEVLARMGRTRESGLARETYERLRLEDFRRRVRR
jgi:tetratricopeptide (TPR) repeat protein